MNWIDTLAIVLNTKKYADKDAIAQIYTQTNGVESFIIKGFYASTTKKRQVMGAYFMPLQLLSINYKSKKNRQLILLKQYKLQTNITANPHLSPQKRSVCLFIADFLFESLRHEPPNPDLFDLTEKTLKVYISKSYAYDLIVKFFLEITRFLGFYPNTSDIEHDYFDLLEGIFSNQLGSRHVEGKLWRLALTQNAKELNWNNKQRHQFLKELIDYYSIHIQSFIQPKSFQTISELWR